MPRLRGNASSQAVTPKAKHNPVGSDSDNPFLETAVQKGKAKKRGKTSSSVTPKAKHNPVGSDSDDPFFETTVRKGKAKKGKAVSKDKDEVELVEDDSAVGENNEVQDANDDGDPVMDIAYQDKRLSKTYEKLPHLRFALQCFHIGFRGLTLSCFQSILRRPGSVWWRRVDSSAIH